MRGSAIALLLAVACGASPPPEPSRASPSPAPTPRAEAASPADEPAPAVPAEVVATEPAEAPLAIGCEVDADCGWDDLCAPTRCVEHRERAAECSASREAPGACACLGGHCTLVPAASARGPACRSFCSADPSGGTCLADDTRGLLPDGVIGPGAGCTCEGTGASAACRYDVVPLVPCTDARDCDVEDGALGLRPIRARHRRRRDFVPCRDGDWAPVCNRGACGIVGFGC